MHVNLEICRILSAPIIFAFLIIPKDSSASAVQSISATAEILKDIKVSLLNDMEFGRIVVSDQSGTVVIDPGSNIRTCEASVSCAGSYARALLKLSGSDANVRVNLSPSFLLSGPGQDMLAEPILPGGSDPMITLSGGEAKVYLGARLHINAQQQPGTYTGTFKVTVDYN